MRTLGLLLALCTFAATTLAQDLADPDRVARWSEDIDQLASGLAEKHMDFFRELDEDEFAEAVEAAKGVIAERSDDAMVYELARLAAMAGDSHTRATPRRHVHSDNPDDPSSPIRIIPIGLLWMTDGPVVLAVTGAGHDALGGRLLAINGVGTSEIASRMSEFAATDNEGGFRLFLSQIVSAVGALEAAGIVSHTDVGVDISILTGDGEEITLGLRLVDATRATLAWRQVPNWKETTLPLYLQKASGNYQSAFDEPTGTMFVAYNRCQSAPDLPFEKFTGMVKGWIAEFDAERLVIDFRHNGGGNERVFWTMIEMIEELDDPIPVYGIIGPRTFSSAMSNAEQLRKRVGALLVGEPTGGKPHSFGEVRTFTLPNSKTTVAYSTKFWKRAGDDPDADAIYPDIAAPLTIDDYLNGRDPAMAAIIEHEAAAEEASP